MLVSFKAIGRNIRAARTALDITQEEAADRLKISQLHFGRLERGAMSEIRRRFTSYLEC